MSGQFVFITKVILASWLISCLIKYVLPKLSIASSNVNALVAVCLPSLIIGVLLWQRTKVQK